MTPLDTFAVVIVTAVLVGSIRARRHLEAERTGRLEGSLRRWRSAPLRATTPDGAPGSVVPTPSEGSGSARRQGGAPTHDCGGARRAA